MAIAEIERNKDIAPNIPPLILNSDQVEKLLIPSIERQGFEHLLPRHPDLPQVMYGLTSFRSHTRTGGFNASNYARGFQSMLDVRDQLTSPTNGPEELLGLAGNYVGHLAELSKPERAPRAKKELAQMSEIIQSGFMEDPGDLSTIRPIEETAYPTLSESARRRSIGQLNTFIDQQKAIVIALRERGMAQMLPTNDRFDKFSVILGMMDAYELFALDNKNREDKEYKKKYADDFRDFMLKVYDSKSHI